MRDRCTPGLFILIHPHRKFLPMHKRTRSLKSTAQRTLASLAVAAAATFGLSAQAAIVSELGDAGQTQGTAQVTIGNGGSITSIFGSIASTTDADLFVIYIANPAQFRASTNNGGTDAGLDTVLFLLTADGAPVYLNDDDASGTTLGSTLPNGDPAGPLTAGLYILGVSMSGYDPVNSNNQLLFAGGLPTDVRGPANGLQPSVLGGFDGGGFFDPGNYEIQLRGASFAVPEPGSALLVLLAGGALLGTSRQRRRHTQAAEGETTAA